MFRRNISLKSTLRQPMRTAVLMLLIGVAAFAFFLRTVEYVAVRAELIRLGDSYRSIGLIRHPDFWIDVSEAAEILEASPYIGTVERRFGVEGVLLNTNNADVAGSRHGLPREEQPGLVEAVFTAIPLGVWHFQEEGFLRIEVVVTERLGGFWELTPVWTPVMWNFSLRYDLPQNGETTETLERLQGLVDSLEELDGHYLLSDAEPLIFHGYRMMQFNPFGFAALPNPGQAHWLSLKSVHDVDEDISTVIAEVERNSRTVNLQPVVDMTALPHVNIDGHWQLGIGYTVFTDTLYPFRINHGRMLTYEDYLYANPVVVVCNRFLHIRRMNIGDTLVVEIPRRQEVHGINFWHRDLFVRGIPDENPDDVYVIELTIVGSHSNSYRNAARDTYGTRYMYIPASVLPDGLEVNFTVPGMEDGALPAFLYHFTLVDNRIETEQRFLETYQPLLMEMGLDLAVLPSGSQQFWLIVDPIILTLTFNAVVFWVVLVLVSALVVFLYINQRRKEMAIQQALGISRLRIMANLIFTAFCFTAPGTLIGGYIGWNVATNTAQYTLGGITEIVPAFVPAVELTAGWALLMGSIVFGILLAMVFAVALYILNFPVLNQLQGTLVRLKKPKKTAVKDSVPPQYMQAKFAPLPAFNLKSAFTHSFRNSLNWVRRQIVRSQVKTALLFLVATFLVTALGWLQESILRTENDIEYLFQTTEVWAEIRQENLFEVRDDRYLGDVIHSRTADRIRDKHYITNLFIEGGSFRSFIVAPDENGLFPADNWHEVIGFDMERPILWRQNLDTLDFTFAFNDLELFITENTIDDVDWGLQIDFYEGFGVEDFNFTAEDFAANLPVPVILPDSILERRGLNIGDEAFFAYTRFSPRFWTDVPIIIIGRHNGEVFRESASEAIFLPIEAYQSMFGELGLITSISFMIDPAYNHQTIEIREDLINSIFMVNPAIVRIILHMSDHNLHTMVGIARQTLMLLTLIYPLAIGASIFIAAGLSLLIMLQNAKNAAVLRVLGAPRIKVAAMLITEQLIVCLIGAAAGGLVLASLGANFGEEFLFVLGLYFAGILAGTISGAIVICNRTPMNMLQVKE